MEAEPADARAMDAEPTDARAVQAEPVGARAMVAPVAAAARAYGALTMASLRSSVQRPATLVVRGIGSALVALCEAVGVVLLVDRFGSIAGWRTPEIIVLAGLVFTGQGLAQAVGNRLRPDDVSLMIRRGTFDQVLMKPVGGYLSRRTFHPGSWWKLGRTGSRASTPAMTLRTSAARADLDGGGRTLPAAPSSSPRRHATRT